MPECDFYGFYLNFKKFLDNMNFDDSNYEVIIKEKFQTKFNEMFSCKYEIESISVGPHMNEDLSLIHSIIIDKTNDHKNLILTFCNYRNKK